jgi:hypothetical protein
MDPIEMKQAGSKARPFSEVRIATMGLRGILCCVIYCVNRYVSLYDAK